MCKVVVVYVAGRWVGMGNVGKGNRWHGPR